MNKPLYILIVGGSDDDVELILHELRHTGYDPTYERVDTLIAMKAALDKQTWDVVVADYSVLKFSGLTALRLLREKGLGLPFIIVSDIKGEDIAMEAMKAGATDYIMKDKLERLNPAIESELRMTEKLQEEKQKEEVLNQPKEYLSLLLESLQLIPYICEKEGIDVFESKHKTKSGKIRDVLVSTKVLSIPGRNLISSIWYDITEHKKADERIKRLAKFPSENPYPVLRISKDGKILFANDASLSLLNFWGLKTGQFVSESWRKLTSNVLSFNSSKNTEIEYENRVFSLTFAPVVESGYVNVYGLDITERKQMEEALLQSEKMKALGVMTTGVVHEFNNILGIISGNAQLLEAKHKDDKDLRKTLRTICRVANDGADIVKRMYEFNVRKDTSQFIRVNIEYLIKHVIDYTMPRWNNMAQAKGITYHIDKKGIKKVPTISGNPSGLREILVNIVNNALDAMPDGGKLSFCTWGEGESVFMSITDTGKGMTEEVMKKIFDPFFTTRRPEGTGLGMSVAYGIVTRHNGEIKVASKEGKGSTITLKFPITEKAVCPETFPKPARTEVVKNLNVLVVDDEQDMCELLDDFFTEEGHKVTSVISGADAIEILKIEEFDLIICDLAMPEVTGRAVIKALDTLDKRPKVGLITGWKYKMEDMKKEDLKVDFVVQKPFKLSELRREINNSFNSVTKPLIAD